MYPSVKIANAALARSQALSKGHKISLICTMMDMDDKDVHAKCSCGWRSKDVRADSHAAQLGQDHINQVKK